MLRAAPQRWSAARLGPGWVSAPFLVRPLQAAGWALEKAACSWPEHREPETGRGSKHPLLGGAPELVDRRDPGKAGLASRGHSRGRYLWGRRVQERLEGLSSAYSVSLPPQKHRLGPPASLGEILVPGAPLRTRRAPDSRSMKQTMGQVMCVPHTGCRESGNQLHTPLFPSTRICDEIVASRFSEVPVDLRILMAATVHSVPKFTHIVSNLHQVPL